MREAKGLDQGNGTVNVFMRVSLSRMCYLRITLICVYVINKPFAREAEYMCLISWTHRCGSKQYIMDEVHRSRFGITGHAGRRINIISNTFVNL
jgi:hypothetical protein